MALARIWARRLIAGTQQFSKCPCQDLVIEILKEEVANGNPDCTAERFEEITGQPYTA